MGAGIFLIILLLLIDHNNMVRLADAIENPYIKYMIYMLAPMGHTESFSFILCTLTAIRVCEWRLLLAHYNLLLTVFDRGIWRLIILLTRNDTQILFRGI